MNQNDFNETPFETDRRSYRGNKRTYNKLRKFEQNEFGSSSNDFAFREWKSTKPRRDEL